MSNTMLRGGSWDFNRGDARSPDRSRSSPSYRNYDVGFRVLCSSPNNNLMTMRGGSWVDDRDEAWSAYRYRNDPGYRYGLIGFRVLCTNGD